MDKQFVDIDKYINKLRHMFATIKCSSHRKAFTNILICKALLGGGKGVNTDTVPNVDDYGLSSWIVYKIPWIREGEKIEEAIVRVFREGVEKFFRDNIPLIFNPSANKLARHMYDYCFESMPIDKGSKSGIELTYFKQLSRYRNDAIARFVEIVYSRYKDNVPVLCSSKFPLKIAKWKHIVCGGYIDEGSGF